MTTTANRQPAIVLLVEDDQGDQLLTQEAFQALKVPYELRTVSDGKEALEYLYRKGSYQEAVEAPRPDLILLDLNMPRVNGQQVAAVLNADPQFRTIPVVVLTTSRRQEDVLKAYSHGIMSYVGKPLDFQHFVVAVQELEPLLKLIVSLKAAPDDRRVTDRQVFRLARRMRQLERRAEQLFNRYMQRMEEMLAPHDTLPAQDAVSPARPRKPMSEMTGKMVRAHTSAKVQAPPGAMANAEPQTIRQASVEDESGAASLYQLAHRLQDLTEQAPVPARPQGRPRLKLERSS